MIRDNLRRLLGRGQVPVPPSAPPAPVAPPAPSEEEDTGPLVEVEAPEVKRWIEAGGTPLFLDIRERYEVAHGVIEGALWIPMNDVPARQAELPRDRPLVVYCAHGVRSFGVAHWLREQGFEQAWSLVEGVGAWWELMPESRRLG